MNWKCAAMQSRASQLQLRERDRESSSGQEVDVSRNVVDDNSELCIEMGSVEMVEVRVTTSLAEMGSMLGLRPGFVVAVQTGWDMEDADHAREVENLLTNEDTFSNRKFLLSGVRTGYRVRRCYPNQGAEEIQW